MSLALHYITLTLIIFLSSLSLAQHRAAEQALGGPVLTANEAPALYELFNRPFGDDKLSVVERLGDAQDRLLDSRSLSINELVLIDSLSVRAVVQRDIREKKSMNTVYLTKGMILFMAGLKPSKAKIEQLDRKRLQKALIPLIAGVLAHEYAHPIDDISEKSIANRHGSKREQAIETKADINGALIAEAAGFPIEGGYKALKRFQEVNRQALAQISMMKTYHQAHPEEDVRIGTLEALLTARAIEFGTKSTLDLSPLLDNSRDIIEEIFNDKKRIEFWKVPQERTFNESLDVLERLANKYDSNYKLEKDLTDFDIFRTNQMWINILKQLMTSQTLQQDVQTLHRRVNDNSHLSSLLRSTIKDGNGIRRLLESHGFFPKELEKFSPQEFIRSQSFFYSNKFIDALMSEKTFHTNNIHTPIDKKKGSSFFFNVHSYQGQGTTKWNNSVNFTEFSQGLIPWGIVTKTIHHDLLELYRKNALVSAHPAGSIYSNAHFYKYAWSTYTKKEKLEKLNTYLLGNSKISAQPNSGIFFSFLAESSNIWVNDFDKLRLEWDEQRKYEIEKIKAQAHNGDSEARSIYTDYQKLAMEIYKLRGPLSLYEFSKIGYKVDWKHIAELINIDEKTVLEEVERSFVEILESKQKFRRHQSFLHSVPVGSTGGYGKNNNEVTFPKDIDRDRWKPDWINEKQPYLRLLRPLIASEKESKARALLGNDSRSTTKEFYEREYGKKALLEINKTPASQVIDHDFIKSFHEKIVRQVVGDNLPWDQSITKALTDTVVSSSLTLKQKKDWLKKLYLENSPYGVDNIITTRHLNDTGIFPDKWEDSYLGWSTEKKRFLEIYRAFKDVHLYKNSFDYLLNYRKFYKVSKDNGLSDRNDKNDAYFRIVNFLAEELVSDSRQLHQKRGGPKTLSALMMLISVPNYADGYTAYNAGLARLKKHLVENFEKYNTRNTSSLWVFDQLVKTGPTLETDSFFEKYIDKQLNLKEKEAYLRASKIFRSDLQIKLTRQVMQPKIASLELKEQPTPKDINNLFNDIEDMSPKANEARDKYLEELGWRLNLSGKMLIGLVENYKSSNWFRPENMSTPQWASLAVAVVRSTTLDTRWEMIRYLMDPIKFPNGIELLRSELSGISSSEEKDLDVFFGEEMTRKIKEYGINRIIDKIEKFAFESTAHEKIPLFRGLIGSDHGSLSVQKNFMDKVIYEMLKIETNSVMDKLLRTELSIRPQHERLIFISYMLGNSKGGKMDVADFLETRGPVGKKGGQGASIWELFDQETNEQLKRLKIKAKGLSKAQLEEALAKQEGKIYQGITILKLLGSASIKTVALVRLASGEKAVLMVRNPNIYGQIDYNLKLSKNLLVELEKRQIFEGTSFFKMLVKALEEQLIQEIEFDHEMRLLSKAKPFIQKINRNLDLQGWKLDIIQPLAESAKSDIALTTLAEGVLFDELSEKSKKYAGRAIVKANLALFFRYGMFEPDRHKGNFLINEKSKKVTFIDLGQLERFKKSWIPTRWDDRVTVARFIQGMQESNPKTLLRMALKMSDSSAKDINQRLMLRDLKKTLTAYSNDSEKLMQELIKTFSTNGLEFQTKFSFGVLKGLMILFGEKYVSTHEFNKILRGEIKRLYLKKSLVPEISKVNLITIWGMLKERVTNTHSSSVMCRRAIKGLF